MKEKINTLFDKILNKLRLKKYKDVILFLVIVMFLHLSLNGLNILIHRINPQFVNPIETKLRDWAFTGGGYVLDALGYDFATCDDGVFFEEQLEKGISYGEIDCISYYFKDGGNVLRIVDACSGFKQLLVTLFLFILFPGPWKQKAWFIPLALVLMFITNIIRIAALGVVLIETPTYWNFFHKDVFKPGYYVVLFLIWVWWNEMFYRGYKKERK